jgi:hypothetical protein
MWRTEILARAFACCAPLVASVSLGQAGSISFLNPPASVSEGASNAVVTLRRTGGSAGAVSVTCRTATDAPNFGGAQYLEDLTYTEVVLTWASGQTANKTCSIPIINNSVAEATEPFYVNIFNPTGGATISGATGITIQINDDDVPAAGAISFQGAALTFAESVGTLSFGVRRTGGSTGAVSVICSTGTDLAAPNGAQHNLDLQNTYLTLNWAAGDTTVKACQVPIFDDVLVEPTEFFYMNLTGPTGGAVLAAPQNFQINLTDNDVPTFSAVWATSGLEKVWRHEKRAAAGSVTNPSWDGSKIIVKAAREEVAGVNLIVETAANAVSNVSVSIGPLTGPGGATIQNTIARTGNAVFSNQGNPLQVLAARYVQILGINNLFGPGNLHYRANVDERAAPPMVRLPPDKWFTPNAAFSNRSVLASAAPGALWTDRPGANKFAPDALIPMELATINVPANSSQLFALDLWVSNSVIGSSPPAGVYNGTVTIRSNGVPVAAVPLQLTIVGTTLPYKPINGVVMPVGFQDTARRFTGDPFPAVNSANWITARDATKRLLQLLHSYRIAPVEESDGSESSAQSASSPPANNRASLIGTAYLANAGYFGPGQGLGDYAYFIGSYSSWRNYLADTGNPETQPTTISATAIQAMLDNYANWFATNAPGCDYAWYVVDEPDDKPTLIANANTWLQAQASGMGPGKDVISLITHPLVKGNTPAYNDFPLLKRFYSWSAGAANTSVWQSARAAIESQGKQWRMYNGFRPGMGTMSTEDTGVGNALWPLQNRYMGVNGHHFQFSANYMWDYQTNGTQNPAANKDVFNFAMTYGTVPVTNDSVYGWQAYNGTNGDGVLAYPGKDAFYPSSNYGLNGYFPSFRLRAIRLGINNELWAQKAAAAAPTAFAASLSQLLGAANSGVPQISYQIGVFNASDPTFQRGGATWSENSTDYENARLNWISLAGF